MQMIARILLPLCLLGLLAACDKPAPQLGQAASAAVAVVDLNKVFTDSKAAKEGMKLLEGVKDQYEPRLKQMQEEMTKAAPEKGQDKAGQAKEDETSSAFGELIAQYQTTLNEERTRLSAILDESLGKALESVRAKRGLKAVFPKEGVAAFDPAIDITDEVLKELDGMNVVFAPAPKAPAAPAAPAAPEQPKAEQPKAEQPKQ